VTDTDRLARLETLVVALLVPLVAALTALVTLSVTSHDTAASGTRAPNTITIENFRYSPDPITVKAGTTITVTNVDRTLHTLTADGGQFETGDLGSSASATITLPSPGRYTYHCRVHTAMTGTIVVR
jgi:plastocyanin